MTECLSALIPPGEYVRIQREPNMKPQPLVLKNGVEEPQRIKVLVGKGTAREAEVFAVALRDRAGAEIVGGQMFGLGLKIERITLPDGSGYTITSGRMFDLAGDPLFHETTQQEEVQIVAVGDREAGSAAYRKWAQPIRSKRWLAYAG